MTWSPLAVQKEFQDSDYPMVRMENFWGNMVNGSIKLYLLSSINFDIIKQ